LAGEKAALGGFPSSGVGVVLEWAKDNHVIYWWGGGTGKNFTNKN